MTENTTIDSERLGTTIKLQPLTRQQRRHAAQAAAYEAAIKKQGTRYIKGWSVNPKGPRHVGAKQIARQNAEAIRPATTNPNEA